MSTRLKYTDRTVIAEHMLSARTCVKRALIYGTLRDVWEAASIIAYDKALLHDIKDFRSEEQVHQIGIQLFLRVNKRLPLLRLEAVSSGQRG